MSYEITTRPNMNTSYVVRNIHGTTNLRCSCGSWLKHWKKGAKSYRATCAVRGCSSEAEVGAHVISVDKRTDRQWWIAPFCKKHNHPNNESRMFLNSRITLVSANKNITCYTNNW